MINCRPHHLLAWLQGELGRRHSPIIFKTIIPILRNKWNTPTETHLAPNPSKDIDHLPFHLPSMVHQYHLAHHLAARVQVLRHPHHLEDGVFQMLQVISRTKQSHHYHLKFPNNFTRIQREAQVQQIYWTILKLYKRRLTR